MANKYSKDHKKLFQADKTQEIINVDDGVQIICKEAFDDANAVEVILPNGLMELEDNAFLRAHDLVKMNLPTSLKKIGNGAFQHCSSLKRIELPESLEHLGLSAFYGCDNLDEIIINGSFEWNKNWINYASPFAYMQSIKKFVSNNKNFIVLDDMLFSSDKTILFRCPTNKRTVCLPEELRYISEYAFYNCRYLTKIEIPSNVTYIGNDAFGRCESLREIHLPEALTKINQDTFSLCSELAFVQFPKNLTEIEEDAFFGCRKLEFFQSPENRKETILKMLESSKFDFVVHSPLDYTETAKTLKALLEMEEYGHLKDLLATNCNMLILREESISDVNEIIDYLKRTFHINDKDKGSLSIDISLSEAYQRDCLIVNKIEHEYKEWIILFTLVDGKINQIVCGDIYDIHIHARNSAKHPIEYVQKCLKENAISPINNQMPCMKCGLPSEKLLWADYSAECEMGGYKGVISFCPHCNEEIEFRESLHYRL